MAALPMKEGHLYKYRNFMKGWQYRYFKLNRSYLLYYDAQHAPSPRSQIVRTEIASVSPCSSFPDKEHCFQIVTKSSDTWYLMAISQSDMQEWMRVLSAHKWQLQIHLETNFQLPPSVASSAECEKPEKEKLELENKGPPSPTMPVPPIPRYMAEFTNQPPPSYDDLFDKQT